MATKRIPLDLPANVHARLSAVADAVAANPALDPSLGKVAALFRSMLVAHFGPDFMSLPPDDARVAADLEHISELRMATQRRPMEVGPAILATLRGLGAPAAAAPAAPSKPSPAPAEPQIFRAPVPASAPAQRSRRDDPHNTTLRDLVGALDTMDLTIFPDNLQREYKLLTTPSAPPLNEPTFKLDPSTGTTVIRYSHLCALLGLVPFVTDDVGTSTSPSELEAFKGSDGDWWVPPQADSAIGYVWGNLNNEPVADYVRSTWRDILDVLKGEPYLELDFAR